MKAGRDSPGTQRMKQDRVEIGRFIGMVLVPQVVPRMTGLEQFGEFQPQGVDLLVGQYTDSGDVPLIMVERNLFVR